MPEEKQEHLKAYFVPAEYGELEAAIRKAMVLFHEDTVDICRELGIAYPESVARQVMAYFGRRLSEDDTSPDSGWHNV
ncbi:hypothetical protein D3C81_1643990 [compost metagenome]